MANEQILRPSFYEGQYLGSQDLTAVVEYGRLQAARHALGAHTWGIAIGLELTETTLAGGTLSVYIQPGLAWDGFGRPILVPRPTPIPPELFKSILFDSTIDNQTPTGRPVQVWLRYVEAATAAARQGFEQCDSEDQFARYQESFRIEIGDKQTPREQRDPVSIAGRSMDAAQALQTFNPTDPATVVADASIPYQTFPVTGTTARWYVPLGVVRWLPNSNSLQPGKFVARDPNDLETSNRSRVMCSVVAGQVLATNDKRVDIPDPKDPTKTIQVTRHYLRLRDRTTEPSTVQSTDLVWVEGSLRVEGDAKLFGSKLDFRDANGVDNGVPLSIQRAENNGRGGTDLKILIGKAAAGKNALAIGALDDSDPKNPKFMEKVIIQDDGKVGIGTLSPRNPLAIRAQGTAEELISFEDPSGATKWHINQNLGGNKPGLNFVETGVADGRLFLAAGGNVGIGTTTPTRAKLEIAGKVGATVGMFGAGEQGIALVASWPTIGFNSYFNNGWKSMAAGWTGIIDVNQSDGRIGLKTGQNATAGEQVLSLPERLTILNNGSVGIGTTAPQAKLHVVGGAIMPAVGNVQTAGIQFPSDPGGGAGDEAFIRYYVEAGETTKLLIGIANDADDTIGFRQFGAERMTIRDGNVGVGTTNPAYVLDVAGAAHASGFPSSSDVRFKMNIIPLSKVLEKLEKIDAISFEWNAAYESLGRSTGRREIGVIAQEVEEVFPELVTTWGSESYRAIDYGRLSAVLLQAIKELKLEIAPFPQRIGALEEKSSHRAGGMIEAVIIEDMRKLHSTEETTRDELQKLGERVRALEDKTRQSAGRGGKRRRGSAK